MEKTFEEITQIYKALADKTRLHMLALLAQDELCVCELVAILQMSQPSISQHLRRLKQVGLVRERKTARWVYYSLTDTQSTPFREIIQNLPDVSEEVIKLRNDCSVSCES